VDVALHRSRPKCRKEVTVPQKHRILIQGRDWPEAEDSFFFQDIVEE